MGVLLWGSPLSFQTLRFLSILSHSFLSIKSGMGAVYHLLQPDRRIDEGIYNDEIDQYFSYREWKKKHQPLSGVTVREILTTEDLNEGALLRIFDGVTAAFYKSDEYNSREYRYSNLSELRKAMKHKEGGTNGKAQ